jgi:hypothetical protein
VPLHLGHGLANHNVHNLVFQRPGAPLGLALKVALVDEELDQLGYHVHFGIKSNLNTGSTVNLLAESLRPHIQ